MEEAAIPIYLLPIGWIDAILDFSKDISKPDLSKFQKVFKEVKPFFFSSVWRKLIFNLFNQWQNHNKKMPFICPLSDRPNNFRSN